MIIQQRGVGVVVEADEAEADLSQNEQNEIEKKSLSHSGNKFGGVSVVAEIGETKKIMTHL